MTQANQDRDVASDSIAIIQADPEHVDLIAPLFDGYRQFYGRASDLEGARTFLRERLENNESVIFLALVERDGQPIPTGFTQLYPLFTSTGMRAKWLLNDLFVAPAMRGLGVGRVLLQHAREYAAETGAASLSLQTAVTNTAAQALYESLGWRRDTEFYTYNLPL